MRNLWKSIGKIINKLIFRIFQINNYFQNKFKIKILLIILARKMMQLMKIKILLLKLNDKF